MTGSSFHSTRWTLVRRAQGRGEEARSALSELCAIYYDPVLRFALGWCGDRDRAGDLAHGFFEDLLARESIGGADPAKGRFRTYLLAAVKHYFSRTKERESAAKRGGGIGMTSLGEVPEVELPAGWEREFDRAWALALIRRALDSLAMEMEAAGKRQHFETLRPWLDGGPAGDSVAASVSLGLSPSALKVTIHRLRERFRQRVRDEIAATTADPEDAREEFHHLVDVWVRTGAA